MAGSRGEIEQGLALCMAPLLGIAALLDLQGSLLTVVAVVAVGREGF